jgi:ABC-2 type transport system permease protein
MIFTIARKEFTEIVRDGRFRWISAIVLMLLAGALVSGWQEVRAARQAIVAARAAEDAVWLDQGPRNPHSAAHFGRYAFKPTPALSYVDRGIHRYLGTAVWLEAHWQNPFQLREAEDRAAVLRFGELTAAWTLQHLVPLLIILLAFGAFAGERERGTLRQLLSLGVRPRALALGKALGLAGALGLVLVPAVVLGAVALALGVGSAGMGDAVARGLVLAAGYLVYCGVFLGISLMVSARAASARTALVALLGFWVAACLLVPRLAADLAERLHPIPDPRAFYAAIAQDEEQGISGHGSEEERQAALERRVLAEYGVETLDALPVNFAGISLQASEEFSNLVFDRHFGELWRLYERQDAVHRRAASLSPLLAVRALSMAVAGTDLVQHRHFAEAAEDHRRELVKFLNDDMTVHAGAADFGYLADPELWARAPRFDYRAPALREVLAHGAGAMMLLGLWLAGSGLGAMAAVRGLRPW